MKSTTLSAISRNRGKPCYLLTHRLPAHAFPRLGVVSLDTCTDFEDFSYQAMGSYARVVPTVVFQGTADPVVAPINGDLVVQQWMQTDHLASHGRYDASFANPSHIITASPPASYPTIERIWNDSTGHEVQEYWVAIGAGHVWTGGSPDGTFTDPLGPNLSPILYRFFLNHPMSLFDGHTAF